MSRPIDRRDFFRAAAAAATGAALVGCERGHDPYALEKPPVPGTAGWLRGEERSVATSCAQCGAGCGVRVRVVEGRAVGIMGNPTSPVNRGGVGPRGLAGVQVLYDPDRVLKPMRRVGPRGVPADEARFEPVEWDVALDALSTHMNGLRDLGLAQRVGILCGRERGMMRELWRRFARAYGTPNLFDGFSTGSGPTATANLLMQGVPDIPAYDWANARYVLSLGSGMLESSCQMVYFSRSQAQARRGRSGLRAKIVHAGPAWTRTAMNADEFVRLRPQTYGAFALGIAHVLVREGLHDADFVREHVLGFERWTDEQKVQHRGFSEVLEEYPPEKVAQLCGVPAARIEKLAREMAAARPCFVLGGSEELLSENGVGAAMAIHALNALLGAIDRPGGLLTQRAPPLADWPDFELDELAETSLARAPLGSRRRARAPLGGPSIDDLPGALLSEDAEPLDTLLVYYSNPLYARARPDRWRQALSRVQLVVSFGPFLDETTAEFADWILPDQTYLERWEDDGAAPSVGSAVFGVRQPVVEPLGEARSTGDVLLQLAQRMSEPVKDAFPWSDFKDALKKRLIGLYKAKRGTIAEEKGSTFLERMYAEGVWHDPAYPNEAWDEVLRTPSGRFELFSTRLWRSLAEQAAARSMGVDSWLASIGVPGGAERLCLPRHDELRWKGDAERYPLQLLPYRPSTYCEGSGANLPWLQELHQYVGRPIWTTEAEIHPETALAAGIADGDQALVESPAGKVALRVHVHEGVGPGQVRIPQGGGHSALGRFAKGWGANVMELVALEGADPIAGISPLQGTRVSIRRLES